MREQLNALLAKREAAPHPLSGDGPAAPSDLERQLDGPGLPAAHVVRERGPCPTRHPDSHITVALASATGPTATTLGSATADAPSIDSGMVYIGVVLDGRRKGKTSFDLEAIDPLPPELVAFNQNYGDIDADLVEYEGDKSFLKAVTRVRFTYSQQGSHICYYVLGLLATRTATSTTATASATGPTATSFCLGITDGSDEIAVHDDPASECPPLHKRGRVDPSSSIPACAADDCSMMGAVSGPHARIPADADERSRRGRIFICGSTQAAYSQLAIIGGLSGF